MELSLSEKITIGIGAIALIIWMVLGAVELSDPISPMSEAAYAGRVRDGGKLLHLIRTVCGDHPEDCPAGHFMAWLKGRKFEFRTLEGITVDKDLFGGNDGFTIYDPFTGEFAQSVVFPLCNDTPGKPCIMFGDVDTWWVEGYRPTAKGEHVRFESYELYDLKCLPPKCEPTATLEYITKLPDIEYTEPIVPTVEMTIFVNETEMGTFGPDEGMDIITNQVNKVVDRDREPCTNSGWTKWLKLHPCRAFDRP